MLNRRVAVAAIAVGLVAVLGGCPIKNPPAGSDLTGKAVPNAQLPPGWTAAPVDTTPVAQGWLATLGDSALLALVTDVLAYNSDLEIAAARIQESEARLRFAGGKSYPTVNIYARGGVGLGGDGSGLNGVLAQAQWEVDIWGRVRYGTAAARAGLRAAGADYLYARQSLAAMAAKSWFLAAELRLEARSTDSLAQATTELLHLLEVRRRVGTSNDQDVALARADLGFYRDRALQLEQQQQEARRAMEVLAGRYPKAALGLPDSFPAALPPVPAGLPLSMLGRRPDLTAASLRVAITFFSTKQAVATKLPRLALTGSFGAISSQTLELKSDFSNPIGSLGANLLVPLFYGGQLNAQVDIHTAEQRAAVAAYGGAVLGALREVENALGAELVLRQRELVLQQMVEENARAVAVSQKRFDVGKEDLLPGLQMRQRLYGAQTSLIHVRAERIIQRINLHLALGGGFVAPPPDSVLAGH